MNWDNKEEVLESSEVGLHSRLIAELIDPNGSNDGNT